MNETTVLQPGERERTLWLCNLGLCVACTEVNTSIVGQARSCLRLSHARSQLGCVWLPYPPDSSQRREWGENAIIVYQLNQRRFLPWLCLLSGQGVGGAAVARSGITGPGRKEPDPGACLGQALPPSFFAAVMQTVGPLCRRCTKTLGQCCCCWEKECLWCL